MSAGGTLSDELRRYYYERGYRDGIERGYWDGAAAEAGLRDAEQRGEDEPYSHQRARQAAIRRIVSACSTS